MHSSTGSSARPESRGRAAHPTRTWIVGCLYAAVVTAGALIAANSGSQAAAEAGRCLLAERNGLWGIYVTATLGAVPLVAEILWVRRFLTPTARWTAAALAGVIWMGHFTLLALFGFLLIRPGGSTASNFANLATIPFSLAPTLAVALTATLLAPAWKTPTVRRIAALITIIACTAASAVCWVILMTRC
jgi:hypothetical protein